MWGAGRRWHLQPRTAALEEPAGPQTSAWAPPLGQEQRALLHAHHGLRGSNPVTRDRWEAGRVSELTPTGWCQALEQAASSTQQQSPVSTSLGDSSGSAHPRGERTQDSKEELGLGGPHLQLPSLGPRVHSARLRHWTLEPQMVPTQQALPRLCPGRRARGGHCGKYQTS